MQMEENWKECTESAGRTYNKITGGLQLSSPHKGIYFESFEIMAEALHRPVRIEELERVLSLPEDHSYIELVDTSRKLAIESIPVVKKVNVPARFCTENSMS